MRNRITPVATWLDRLTIEFRFPYDADFIEQLKNAIPARYREYTPDTKAWTVSAGDPAWARTALELFMWTFPSARVIYPRSAAAPPPATPGYATLHLLPTAPPELVRAAYKTLAKREHPDHGGDLATMQAINGAYAALRKAGAA